MYQLLYPGQELVCGMDQPFFCPENCNGERSPASNHQGNWGHVDQNTQDICDTLKRKTTPITAESGDDPDDFRTWQIYQSVVSVWPSALEDGQHADTDWTSVIWPDEPGKQKAFDVMMEELGPGGARASQFVPLSQLGESERVRALRLGYAAEARRVRLPAGSMLVWNSRTLHQGYNNHVARRLAQPVCWEPAQRLTNGGRYRKTLAVVAKLRTTHWASLGNISFGRGFSEHPPFVFPVPLRPGCLDDAATRARVEGLVVEAQAIAKTYATAEEYEGAISDADGEWLAGLLQRKFVRLLCGGDFADHICGGEGEGVGGGHAAAAGAEPADEGGQPPPSVVKEVPLGGARPHFTHPPPHEEGQPPSAVKEVPSGGARPHFVPPPPHEGGQPLYSGGGGGVGGDV